MIELLMSVRQMKDSGQISKAAESRILKQVAILLRDQLDFTRACESILDRTDI